VRSGCKRAAFDGRLIASSYHERVLEAPILGREGIGATAIAE
jgi:hypothetical protein